MVTNSLYDEHQPAPWITPLPLDRRDYLIAGTPLFILLGLLAFIFVGGIVQEAQENQREAAYAEQYWTRLVQDSPIPGRNENGDCFLFAIGLRDLIQQQTGQQAKFVFVRWTDLDPAQGPTVHVYTQFDALNQTWVVDNMGTCEKFPLGTPANQWMTSIAPKGLHYLIIGDTHAMVQYVSSM